MQINTNMSESLAILAQLPSASQGTGSHTVGPVNMQNFRRLLFVLDIGVLGGSGTVDFQLQAATTSGGSYTEITGTQITTITSGSSNIVTVEVRAETLNNQGLGTWVKGVLAIGTAASQVGVMAFGAVGRYEPESDFNISAVAQQLVA